MPPVVSCLMFSLPTLYAVSGDLLMILILLLCSALFSGSEVAFFSLTPAQLDHLHNAKKGVKINFIYKKFTPYREKEEIFTIFL